MTIDQPTTGPLRYTGRPAVASGGDTTNLADLLERILDKGIVIAGDISVSLVDVELLTIKLRLLIASVDKAREIGVSWWERDPWLSGRTADQGESRGGGDREAPGSDGEGRPELLDRLERLESAVARLTGQGSSALAEQRDPGDQEKSLPSGNRR